MEASVTVCQHHDVDRLAVAERGGVDRQLFDLARASRSCRIERPACAGGAHGPPSGDDDAGRNSHAGVAAQRILRLEIEVAFDRQAELAA